MAKSDQFCVRLPVEPAEETGDYALYRLSRRDLDRITSGRIPSWKRVQKGKKPVPGRFHPSAKPRKKAAKPVSSKAAKPSKCRVNCRILHHGVGRDRPATTALRRQKCRCEVDEYDPFHPDPAISSPPTRKYDQVVSAYVLNVIPPREGRRVLRQIRDVLKPHGEAIITVRRDLCR